MALSAKSRGVLTVSMALLVQRSMTMVAPSCTVGGLKVSPPAR